MIQIDAPKYCSRCQGSYDPKKCFLTIIDGETRVLCEGCGGLWISDANVGKYMREKRPKTYGFIQKLNRKAIEELSNKEVKK